MQALNSAFVWDRNNNINPESVILQLYDLGIESCNNKEVDKATKVLTELINALNFEYSEMATSFCKLYQYVLGMVRVENFEQALYILIELRDAWKQALISKECVT